MSTLAVKRPPPQPQAPPATLPAGSFTCKAGAFAPSSSSSSAASPKGAPGTPSTPSRDESSKRLQRSPSSSSSQNEENGQDDRPSSLQDISTAPPTTVLSEDELERRVAVALRSRDEEWRRHEAAQIAFLQSESTAMLRGLHGEIDRLSHRLRDARRLLDVGHCTSEQQMAARLSTSEARISELEQLLHDNELLQSKVTTAFERMSEQIAVQAERIRQQNSELHDRTATVTQLSNQLRAYRLREAMSIAQQRRRVSNPNFAGARQRSHGNTATLGMFGLKRSSYLGNARIVFFKSLAQRTRRRGFPRHRLLPLLLRPLLLLLPRLPAPSSAHSPTLAAGVAPALLRWPRAAWPARVARPAALRRRRFSRPPLSPMLQARTLTERCGRNVDDLRRPFLLRPQRQLAAFHQSSCEEQ